MQTILPNKAFFLILWSVSKELATYLFYPYQFGVSSHIRVEDPITLSGAEAGQGALFSESREEKPVGNTKLDSSTASMPHE